MAILRAMLTKKTRHPSQASDALLAPLDGAWRAAHHLRHLVRWPRARAGLLERIGRRADPHPLMIKPKDEL